MAPVLRDMKESVGVKCPLNKTKDQKVFKEGIEIGINTRDKIRIFAKAFLFTTPCEFSGQYLEPSEI